MSALAYFPCSLKWPVVVSHRSQNEPSPSPNLEVGPKYLFISGTSCNNNGLIFVCCPRLGLTFDDGDGDILALLILGFPAHLVRSRTYTSYAYKSTVYTVVFIQSTVHTVVFIQSTVPGINSHYSR